jgi:U2 small nuclear ribonucleoprotein A'
MRGLKYLTLMDNPVSKADGYRLKIIALIPSLRVLDFKKVSKFERDQAALQSKKRSSDTDQGPDKKAKLYSEPGQTGVSAKSTYMSKEQKEAIREAIGKASSLDEIARLERILETGHVPE